jgi:hypothetical protein
MLKMFLKLGLTTLLLAIGLAGLLFSLSIANPVQAVPTPTEDVDICHATGSHENPYVPQSPDATADAGGHDGHNGPIWYFGIVGGWGDIIPPFEYDGGSYPGKNYTAEGEAILANNCNIPVDEEEDVCTNIPGTQSDVPENYYSIEDECFPKTGVCSDREALNGEGVDEETEYADDELCQYEGDPTPTPEAGKTSSIGYNLSCDGGYFAAGISLKDNGVPVSGILVNFNYHGRNGQATTNNDGAASVNFPKEGNYVLEINPDGGFPSQSMVVEMPVDCPAGTTVGGQVLGLATTGIQEELTLAGQIALLFSAQAGLGLLLRKKLLG